jgi:repressor LexA
MSRAIQVNTPSVTREVPVAIADRDMVSIPFHGVIAAGEPIMVEAVESPADTVEINRSLFGRDISGLFALKVEGNSMIDALINDGDTVILKHQDRVENGQMAAVWLDDEGETTLKKVYYEGKQVRLQPANPTMSAFYVPANKVRVQGKVVLVIRQLA